MASDQDGTYSVDTLMVELPTGDDPSTKIEWLLKLFTLWDEGENQEVSARRREIASRAGRAWGIFPTVRLDDVPPPKLTPGNDNDGRWLLEYGLKALMIEDDFTGVRCWYFTAETRRWLGLPQA